MCTPRCTPIVFTALSDSPSEMPKGSEIYSLASTLQIICGLWMTGMCEIIFERLPLPKRPGLRFFLKGLHFQIFCFPPFSTRKDSNIPFDFK